MSKHKVPVVVVRVFYVHIFEAICKLCTISNCTFRVLMLLVGLQERHSHQSLFFKNQTYPWLTLV